MAPNDAEMPAARGLATTCRRSPRMSPAFARTLQGLTGDVKRLGGHQVENMQDTADAALDEVAAAVRRNPLTALAIAVGAGFLYGVLTRR